MRNLMSALAVLTLSAVGCKDRSDVDAPPSAQKQVEQVSEQSARAYERAKEAQERAADEAEEAARAQAKVQDEREDLMKEQRELAEAEAKAELSAAEAQHAQQAAQLEGESAHAEAQSLNARAQQLQNQAMTEQPIVTPDINDDYVDPEVEIERLRAQINEAMHRVFYGTEQPYESLDERLDRLGD